MTSARKRQKLRTRRKLIDAARALFAEQGLATTTTEDVASAAGVSHGTVFAHFPTRGALLVAVIEEFGADVGLRTHEAAANGAGTRAVLQAHLQVLEEYEELYARVLAEASVLPHAARTALIGLQSAISCHLFEALQRETAAGTIRVCPMHLLLNTWIGLIHHYLLNRDLFAPGESVIARWGAELLDHYMWLLSSDGQGGAT
jgi:AcrR family transcriptional regulator